MPSKALPAGPVLPLALGVLLWRAVAALDVGDKEIAVDAECSAEEAAGGACAVRMLQTRGRKVDETGLSEGGEAPGSCRAYGCTGYQPSQSCQCNAKCKQFGNCCRDFQAVCAAGSCSARGCGKFDPAQACQCNEKCQKYGNCCGDYASTCGAAGSGSCQASGCGKYDRSRSCQCNSKCTTFGNCCHDYAATCAAGGAATCRTYGCGRFDRSRKCQCNDRCQQYGNCCPDYHSTCAAPPASGSCSAYGCGKYDKLRPCQCTAKCAKYGNCCKDYQSACAAGPAGPPGQHGNVYGHPSPSKHYPFYEGFTLSVVEEFDSPLDLDSDPIWTWSDGGLIEGQIRYVREGLKFEDGKLKISVNRHSPKVQACSVAESTTILPKSLASGEMRSKHNMFRYGRYEARVKAPEVQPGDTEINGNYVATMFVFRDGKYKHWREIDVEITGNGVDTLHTNVLSADHTPEWNADMGEEKDLEVGKNLRAGFHTYAIEWLPHRIRWFFDGKIVREKIGGKIPIPSMSAKVMMNLWVFDDRALFGGKEIKNNRFPLTSEYDWFRFYKWNGDAHYPCDGMSTACLTADDRYLSGNNPCDGILTEGTIYGKPACKAECR